MPPGYTIGWSGEYESEKRAEARLAVIVPLTVLVIFIILYTMFRSYKWALLILLNVGLARVGGFLALLVTGTYLSVSSGVGMLALFGVSVQTGVIMLEYINQLRARGHSIVDAAVEGAVLRLRPIMMTMLVATLGLLPAALSHDIGSDSQRPFAIVIVGGLISDLLLSIVLLPTFYVWIARDGDRTSRHRKAPLRTMKTQRAFGNMRRVWQSLPCSRPGVRTGGAGRGQDHAGGGHPAGARAQPHPAGRADHHPTEPGRGSHRQPAPEPDLLHRLGIPAAVLPPARRDYSGITSKARPKATWG